MSPYEFRNVLVPVDGSEGSAKALRCALSICAPLGARLTPLAVEGRLPAYAASVGEVEEVKREKDEYFRGVLERADEAAHRRGVDVSTDLVPGHAGRGHHPLRARPRSRPDRHRPPRPLPRGLSAPTRWCASTSRPSPAAGSWPGRSPCDDIAHFFSVYKEPDGHNVTVDGWWPREDALEAIEVARQRHREQRR
jgi:Universal stress protein family